MSKVFAVGFNKSGTTSLHRLFKSLGLRSFHGVAWRSGENREILDAYDCFSDGIPRDFVALDRTFPGSRFILQVRELEPWILSRLAHIARRRAAGLERPGETGPDWDLTEVAVEAWIRRRNEHHIAVLDHFSGRPDFIVVNFIRDADAADRIAAFLGRPGARERPAENRNPEQAVDDRHRGMLAAVAARLGLAPEELGYDILAPSLAPTAHPPDTRFIAAR